MDEGKGRLLGFTYVYMRGSGSRDHLSMCCFQVIEWVSVPLHVWVSVQNEREWACLKGTYLSPGCILSCLSCSWPATLPLGSRKAGNKEDGGVKKGEKGQRA